LTKVVNTRRHSVGSKRKRGVCRHNSGNGSNFVGNTNNLDVASAMSYTAYFNAKRAF
jgi:hypothetical protein